MEDAVEDAVEDATVAVVVALTEGVYTSEAPAKIAPGPYSGLSTSNQVWETVQTQRKGRQCSLPISYDSLAFQLFSFWNVSLLWYCLKKS